MVNILHVKDMIDIGIEKEKARRDFYAQVASHFSDTEIKGLFTKLRDWEETHIRKFNQIRDQVDKSKTTESYPGELQAYIGALVDDKLYQEVSAEKFVENIKTVFDAIRYGIGFEKDAILLFMELIRIVQEENIDLIMKLIEEERYHIIYLINLRKKYMNKSS